jgi:hypothetical protein
MDNFLPDNYEVPASKDNYMKFIVGETRSRILCSPIIGYEFFTEAKPIRSKEFPKETPGIKQGGRVKHFWAMVVWNYNLGCLQILEITQKTIMEAIIAFTKSPDYGSPLGFDITVTRTGEGLDTTYTVLPSIPKPVDDAIATAFTDSNIQLEKLYKGENPFEQSIPVAQSVPPVAKESPPVEDKLTFKEASDISAYLGASNAEAHLENKLNSLEFHNAIQQFCGDTRNIDEWWEWINKDIVPPIRQSFNSAPPAF